MKTQVAIIGAGPAGLLLSEILHQHGIESVVLEKSNREQMLSRIRAGVLMPDTVDLLTSCGLGARIAAEGKQLQGFNIAWNNENIFIDIEGNTHKKITIYGQSKIQEDLFIAADKRHAMVLTEVEKVALNAIDSNSPFIEFAQNCQKIILNCDFIAGCDGSHGISHQSVLGHVFVIHQQQYPFSWLGVLSATSPLPFVTYANHARGFALASSRNASISRYYIQVASTNKIDEWSDDRFWMELKSRFPSEIASQIETGLVLEKSIVALRSQMISPMQYGNLFLAGDAAHILPPTGAKGLNLAVSDVFHLSRALIDYYETGSRVLLDSYSEMALRKVSHAMETASYMTNLLHDFSDPNVFHQQQRELFRLRNSDDVRAQLAREYIGY